MHGITKFLKNKLLRGSNQAKISMIDVPDPCIHTMTRNIHTKIEANLCSILREVKNVKIFTMTTTKRR